MFITAISGHSDKLPHSIGTYDLAPDTGRQIKEVFHVKVIDALPSILSDGFISQMGCNGVHCFCFVPIAACTHMLTREGGLG